MTCPHCEAGELRPVTFRSRRSGLVLLADELRCDSCGEEVPVER